MSKQNLSFKEANQIDLVDYLETLGFRPKKFHGQDYWYLSPFREEKTASFKVNRRINAWYDHGLGIGGSLVDLGMHYYQCSNKEFLARLNEGEVGKTPTLTRPQFQQPQDKTLVNTDAGKIVIRNVRTIEDPGLRSYLQKRQIPFAIAQRFCSEIAFELYGKKHLAIGFKNDSGGYELRNDYFKGSSTPKQPRFITGKLATELMVFEGFFDFLSFQTLKESNLQSAGSLSSLQGDILILNSIAFLEKSRTKMEQYGAINLLLDRDNSGIAHTRKALTWSVKYKDQSSLYHQHKDFNDWLVKSANIELKQSRGTRRRL